MGHPALAWLLFGREEGGQFFVEGEEVGDSLGFAGEVGLAIGGIDGMIEGVMGFDQIGWHG